MTEFMISEEELIKGIEAFRLREPRDAMYTVATFLINHYWEKSPADIANGLGVLLLTWNNAHLRYGSFSYDKLENCIVTNKETLNIYRNKSIDQYTDSDEAQIVLLFEQFLDGLQVAKKTKKGETISRSPVGVAKALHLLAPGFFPLWDEKIAKAYECDYSKFIPARQYLKFFHISRQIAANLTIPEKFRDPGKTILKLIDEHNYSKHTKGWI